MIIVTSLVVNCIIKRWSRFSSLWLLLYGTSCCFIEFASLIGSQFDFDRFGLVPRSIPRYADPILTPVTVTVGIICKNEINLYYYVDKILT